MARQKGPSSDRECLFAKMSYGKAVTEIEGKRHILTTLNVL